MPQVNVYCPDYNFFLKNIFSIVITLLVFEPKNVFCSLNQQELRVNKAYVLLQQLVLLTFLRMLLFRLLHLLLLL